MLKVFRPAALLTAVAVLLQILAVSAAASEPLEGYIVRLERVLQSLEASLSSIGDVDAVRVSLDAALRDLPERVEVDVTGGRTLVADHRRLKAIISGLDPGGAEDELREELQAASGQVQLMIEETRALIGAGVRAADKDRELLEKILASREFQGPRENWLTRFSRWLSELFLRNAPQIEEPDVAWRPGTGAGIGALVAVVGFVLFTFWYMQRRLGGDQGALKSRAAGHRGDAAPPDPFTLADEAAARGEFREGLRNLYLGVLQHLDRQGIIRYHPATTDWEYLIRVRRDKPEAFTHFKDLTDLYEERWYGGRPASEADFARGKDLARAVQEGVSVSDPR